MLDPNKAVEQMQSEFAAGFQAGAASRDAEIARLKAIPMRYRRMAFNAQLQDEVARLEQENDQLRAQINVLRDFIASAQVSSGVCCCGEAMDGHSSPMSCGHSPVDMWDHAVEKLLHAPSDTSTPEHSLAEYRNKVIEAFVNEFSRHVGGDGEFWLHELQDFAIKEQP